MLGNKFRRVILAAGSALIGKVRLVDGGGTEVTDGSDHVVKVRLSDGDEIAGKIQLVNEKGEAITDGQSIQAKITGQPETRNIQDGRKTVATTGAEEVLVGATTPCRWVIITAETDNTDKMVVGGPNVIAALATRRGIPLDPGDSVVLEVNDLSKVYIDSLVSGEGVTFVYGV